MLDYGDAGTVAAVLGCGRRTSAHDTVPFALWSAARSLGDFEGAFWTTAEAGGDVDTTCAIVGGVLASGKAGAPPAAWARSTEALPDWVPTAV
jgi:ADP-ribosylglycohydrolase